MISRSGIARGVSTRWQTRWSRRLEICGAISAPRCGWYRRMLVGVKNRPADFPDFRLQNGKLYRHVLHDFREVSTLSNNGSSACPRKEIMQRHHDDPTAGHLGMAKTITRMARLYYWPGMFQDITQYNRRCPNCLAHKVPPMKPAGNLHYASHRTLEIGHTGFDRPVTVVHQRTRMAASNAGPF